MEKSALRRADLMFSFVLIGISVWIFVQSIKLFFNPFGRRFEQINADELKTAILEWDQSPALLPMILSGCLLICALALMHFAIRQGARLDFFSKEKLTVLVHSREFYVVIVVVGTLCLYIFALIPLCRKYLDFFSLFQGFPFMVATFAYLAGMMLIFNEKKLKAIFMSVLFSAIATSAITFGFGVIAMIPLP